MCEGSPQTCAPKSVCGDGYVNPDDEECDDGNKLDYEGCALDCKGPIELYECTNNFTKVPNSNCTKLKCPPKDTLDMGKYCYDDNEEE